MTTVLGYIQTGSLAPPGPSRPQSLWCRPAHRTTCCVAIFNGGSCCVCVPTTATCFVIEMWGQGGGGGGGCCCGSGPYGGQGGAYAWVTCTTTGTNHILCACTCWCACSNCGICSGSPGQFSRVCNCGGPGGFWCVCGGAQGIWCCFWGNSGCQCSTGTGNGCGGTWGGGGPLSNTWNYYRLCSACLAAPATGATSSFTGLGVPCQCNASSAQTTINASTVFAGCTGNAPLGGGSSGSSSPVAGPFPTVSCACFSSPVVWLGAYGWSDPATASTPFGCLNTQNGPPNSQCGGGMGVGGAAYAGGEQQWMNRCGFCCFQCWGLPGNFPGGGGNSSGGGTAWAQPGHGASGLILISWS